MQLPPSFAVRLPGQTLDIDLKDWWEVASSGLTSLTTPANSSRMLYVLRHRDGSTLIFFVRESPGQRPFTDGELLPATCDITDIESCIRRIWNRAGISDQKTVEDCVKDVRSKLL